MAKKQVVNGAVLSCPLGSSKGTLRVTQTVKIERKATATISNGKPGINLLPMVGTFGTCKFLTASVPPNGVSKPCACVTSGTWIPIPTNVHVRIKGEPILLDDAKLICMVAPGGIITVKNPKQRKSDNKPEKPRCFICGKNFHGMDYKRDGTNKRGYIRSNLINAFKNNKGRKDLSENTHVFYRNVLLAKIAKAKEIAKQNAMKAGKSPKSFLAYINADKDLFLNYPDAIEGHHLITCEAVKDILWYGLFVQYGYDINCPQNGVLLPGDILVACHYKVPLHMGDHGNTFTDIVEASVRKNYVNAVISHIQGIKKSYIEGHECKEITPEEVKKFHEAMMKRSESIFSKVKKFKWRITADGKDYDGGGIGCYDLCRTLSSKKATMQIDLGVKQATNEIAASFAERIAGKALKIKKTCPNQRDHKEHGCIKPFSDWYLECRYNELTEKDLEELGINNK